MSRVLVLVGVVMFIATPAIAQKRVMGWGDGSAGQRDASPNCEELPPETALVVTFVAPVEVSKINRIDAFVDFCTDPTPLLEWWRFDAGAGCRAGSLSVSADFTDGPFTALDPWEGEASAEMTYHPAFEGKPVLARVNVSVVPTSGMTQPIEAGQEFYAFKLVFGNPEMGCGGCEDPACFIVNGLSITHPDGIFYTEMDYTNFATWQGGQGNCPFIVPSTRVTWGHLKAVYE